MTVCRRPSFDPGSSAFATAVMSAFHAVALAQYEQVTVDDLPEKIRAYRPSHVLIAAEDPSELVPLEEAERRYILRVVESVGGNKTLAARVLGIGRKTLYRKLQLYGVSGE